MRPSRLVPGATVILIAALTLGICSTAAAQGPGLKAPRTAIAQTPGQYVKSKLGSFCVSSVPDANGNGVGGCGDAAPPSKPPRSAIVLAPRQAMTLVFRHRPGARDQVEAFSATLLRITDSRARTHYFHPWR